MNARLALALLAVGHVGHSLGRPNPAGSPAPRDGGDVHAIIAALAKDFAERDDAERAPATHAARP
jgi:hypothetical protein